MAIDDEPLALALLQDNIRQVPFLELVASCSNAMEALNLLRTTEVDLIFLDIQMPGLTGLQFLQSLTVRPIAILITAYDNYALEGYNLDVIDYIVKPAPFERFLKACNKANEYFRLKNLPSNGTDANAPEYFFVQSEYGLVKIVTGDIIVIEGLRDYLKIHLSGGKPLVIRMSMKAIEEKLSPKRFMRIHKSYIVAIDRITSLRKGSVFIDNLELPLSELYKESLLAAIGQGK